MHFYWRCPQLATLWLIVSQFIFIILKSNIVISIFDLKPKFQRIHWLLISNTFLTTNKTSQYSEKTIQHINAICFFGQNSSKKFLKNSSVSWFEIILDLFEKFPNAAKADGKRILAEFLRISIRIKPKPFSRFYCHSDWTSHCTSNVHSHLTM